MASSWLTYANLSDQYERKARFLPAMLSVLPLMPASAAVGGPLVDWLKLVLGGVGLGAIVAVGLSHAASAMGNRLQTKLWPRWPFESPTNRWLHPDETRTSTQQRELWYAATKRLTGIDIAAAIATGNEVEATINDAVAGLRNLLSDRPEAERMRVHNVDYGFARNFTGMRPIWMSFIVTSLAICWGAHWTSDDGSLLWATVASVVALILLPIGAWVLPGYVRTKAIYYAESFYGAVTAVDRAEAPDREV